MRIDLHWVSAWGSEQRAVTHRLIFSLFGSRNTTLSPLTVSLGFFTASDELSVFFRVDDSLHVSTLLFGNVFLRTH